MNENLILRNMMLKCKVVVDSKDKTLSQTFKNVKLTTTSEDMFAVGEKMTPLLQGTGKVIIKNEQYELSN